MEHAMLLEQEQRNIFSQRTHTGRILLTEAQIYQGNLVLVTQKHPVRHGLSGEELCSVFTEQPLNISQHQGLRRKHSFAMAR